MNNQEQDMKEEGSRKPSKGFGIAAMILGILSVLLLCIQPFGIIVALAATILGIIGTVKVQGKGMAISGIVMGGISLLTGMVLLICFGSILHSGISSPNDLKGTAWRKGADGSVLYLYKDGTFIHVDKENDFTDNFYSGTYMICKYKDSGVCSEEIENTYDTDFVYEIKLYIDIYVEDGREQDAISDTMQYIYAFQKRYHKGDVVQVCAYKQDMFGSFYPVVETELKKPTDGNQYVALDMEKTSETTSEVPTTEATTETGTSEVPTTEATTEARTSEVPTTEEVTTEAPTTEVTTEAPTTEVTTEAPTTEVTTEAPTTEVTTEARTSEEATTEEATTETTTEATTEEADDEDEGKQEAAKWLKKLAEELWRWLEDLLDKFRASVHN